MFLMKYNLSSL